MKTQIPLDPADQVPLSNDYPDDGTRELRPDVAYKRLGIVNVAFLGLPGAGDREWVLVDAGIPGTAGMIERAAKERFGDGARPAAIIQTHGHFDHVGGLKHLADQWETPVYAHFLEVPYLNGKASYPPFDPKVGGGLFSWLSLLFPSGPVDVRPWIRSLPDDGSVPGAGGWQWIHTPGHSPGHVSLWRESDRTLIAGDAFVTTNQESAYAVAVQKPEMHGPPMFLTPDWEAAKHSVELLAQLSPERVICGHGAAMEGEGMRSALEDLSLNFDHIAVPLKSRYLGHPATAENGSAYQAP